MSINMNGNNNDDFYRYKMPSFQVKIGGRGNGIYTIFENIDKISKSINHPADVILKYIASVSGSNYIPDKCTITGAHTTDKLNEIIIQYIKCLVMCPLCNIPETVPTVSGTKKNVELKLKCSACNNESNVKYNNKNCEKGIDIIIKYIKAGGEWKLSKSMVSKPNIIESNITLENIIDDNPFNIDDI